MFRKLFKQSDKLATAPVVCRYCGMVNNVHISAEVIKCLYCSAPLEDAPKAIAQLQEAEISFRNDNSTRVVSENIGYVLMWVAIIAFIVGTFWSLGSR